MLKIFNNGILLSFLAFSSFAFMDIVNKFIFSKNYLPFFSYVLWLDLFILVFLIIFACFFKRCWLFLKVTSRWGVALRSILSVANTFCSLLAISYLPLHVFYALAFLQPLIAVIFSALFFIEKINLKKLIIIFLGFLGVLITTEIWSFPDLAVPLVGILGGLGIAFTGALSGLVVKKFMVKENTITIAFYNILLSIIVVNVYLLISGESLYIPTTNPMVLVVMASFFAAMGMVIFMKSYQVGRVHNIAPMQYTQIILGILFGYFIFNDVPSIYSMLGCLMITGCSFLILKTEA